MRLSLGAVILGTAAVLVTRIFCVDPRMDDALITAARDNDAEFVDKLLMSGADANACGSWEGCDAALYRAVSKSSPVNLGLIKNLVEHGADVNKPKQLNLYSAARFGHEEVVKYLLEHGAVLVKHDRSISTLKAELRDKHWDGIYQLLFQSR